MNFKEFTNPPAIFRPAPFWSWNDKLDMEELKRQIDEMADKGWGGFFMHSRVGLVTGYLSDEWMELINGCAEQAKKTGTYAWLYDEDKWPSGYAGGEVPKMKEEFRSRALVLIDKDSITDTDQILAEVEVDKKQYIICKRIAPLDSLWFNKTSYVDLMNPEAVRAFIDCTHERYKQSCGKYFGKEIPGIFTDEPCYLMYGHYDVPVVPWSDYLPEFFEKLNRYKIEDNLVKLFLNVDDYKKVRYDFYSCAVKLFLESFTKQYYDWCEKNNLIMTGHFMAEDSLVSQTQWVGSAMPHYQFMHWPGIDKLSRHIDQIITVKQVTSVADQLSKERSFSEVFGCVGQQVSFYHRKWIADWQAALGISFVNHHLSLYSMRGERKRDYPANLFYQQPWWDEEKDFSDYVGRVSYAVSAGKREVDILVIHPVGTVWSEYTPLNRENDFSKEMSLYNKPFDELSKQLAANNLDFHYGDEIILEKHASIKDGKFVVGSHSYDTVIVPPCTILAESTLVLLEKFATDAGEDRLLLLDGAEVPNKVADLSNKVGTINSAIDTLDEYYNSRITVMDRVTCKNASSIFSHVRNTDEGKLIFLTNTNENREVQATINIPAIDEVKILDLMSGDVFNAPIRKDGECTSIDVTFYPAGSVLLVAGGAISECDDVPVFLDSGIAFDSMTKPYAVIKNWDIEVLEDNVLPLNDITLYLDGEKVLENKPVAMAWHDYFYKAEDGTPFAVEYKFNVSKVPNGEVFAAIEVAENLEKITLNGQEVKPLKQKGEAGAFDALKSWKDVNFTKVPITGCIIEGENILKIEGKKINNVTGPGCHVGVDDFNDYYPTEIETVYIVGDFGVCDYDRQEFVITSKNQITSTHDMTYQGYPFYSGKVKLSTKITCDDANEKGLLKFDEVECACISLSINGKQVATKYWAPYIFDVSDFVKLGENDVEITLSTTLFNLMGPNRVSGILDDTGVGPHTFVDFDRFTKKYEFTPFGMGKAYLLK